MTSDSPDRSRLLGRLIDRRSFLHHLGVGGALSLSAAAIPLVQACGSPSGSTGGRTGKGKRGGVITEAALADMHTFNSVLLSDVYSIAASSMIYDPLYMTDPKGTIVPCLAAAMPQVSNGGRTYTVKMRKDAKWTDGTPVTADDVKMTYDFVVAPEYAAVNSPSRTTFSQYMQSVTIVDKYTLAFTSKTVYAPFMAQFMGLGIMPKSVYGALAADAINTAPANTKPTITNGAFKDAVWTQGEQTTFKANTDYYRGAPLIDEYVLKPVANSTNVINLLLSGEADIGQLDNSQYGAAKANSKLNVSIVKKSEFVYAVLQLDPTKSRLFLDKRVRQALYWAMDREAIVHSIYFGYAEVANGPIAPAMADWFDADIKPEYSHNQAKAEQLLDEAGFKKGPDGIRANGDLKLSWEVLVPDTDEVEIQLATAIQNYWKKIGVDIQIKPADLDLVIVPALDNNYNFTMIILGESVGPDPDTSVFWQTRSATTGHGNSGDYSNSQVDKLLEEGVTTLSQGKRKEIYNQITGDLLTDPPALFLVYPEATLCVSKRVLGYSTSQAVSRQYYINKLETTDGK
ncbi:MAG TPA: ABC transporter substrate-binding protein [Candidatus Dormibacteraeota bacterium]|nr:ABC transporter substrate-binding protein [Candidatus Dormibacteraeota bacterium]